MEKNYYVSVPSHWPDVVAEVKGANSTKHARTTFLDYLSRNGLISWKDRGDIRKQILVKRATPGEIGATVSLDYGQRTMVEPIYLEDEFSTADASLQEEEPTQTSLATKTFLFPKRWI